VRVRDVNAAAAGLLSPSVHDALMHAVRLVQQHTTEAGGATLAQLEETLAVLEEHLAALSTAVPRTQADTLRLTTILAQVEERKAGFLRAATAASTAHATALNALQQQVDTANASLASANEARRVADAAIKSLKLQLKQTKAILVMQQEHLDTTFTTYLANVSSPEGEGSQNPTAATAAAQSGSGGSAVAATGGSPLAAAGGSGGIGGSAVAASIATTDAAATAVARADGSAVAAQAPTTTDDTFDGLGPLRGAAI